MNTHLPYMELKKRYEDLKKKSDEMSLRLKAKTRSEMKYRLMAEHSPFHLVTVDFNGNVIASNRPLNEKNQEVLAGTSIYNHIHCSSKGAMKKCFEFVRKSGKKAKLKTQFITHNGKNKNYEIHISPVFISNIVAAFCMSMNVCPAVKKPSGSPKTDVEKLRSMLEDMNNPLQICSNCKKIQDEAGGWTQLESFFMKYSKIKFSHGLCQECSENLYPQFKVYEGTGRKSGY
jgi:PAS domain S-box-containing protein